VYVPQKFRKLRIVSDGLHYNTRIIDVESGEPIDGIVSIEWSIGVGLKPGEVGCMSKATVVFEAIGIDAAIIPAAEPEKEAP
jgi:hypothetical protein